MLAHLLTDAGGTAGFGHLTRTVALAEALADRGFSPRLFVRGAPPAALLSGQAAETSLAWDDGGPAEAAALAAPVIIVDSYLPGPAFYDRAARSARVGVWLDDELRLDYPPGIVVNGAIGAESFPYPERPGVERLLGTRYTPLRRAFRVAPPPRPAGRPERLLLLLGGSDLSPLRDALLAALRTAFPDRALRTLAGAGAEGVRAAMAWADAAVSAAGQTLYELARLGVPTVGIQVADNQSRNVRGWVGAGFLDFAGRAGEAGLPAAVIAALHRLDDPAEAARRGAAGQAHCDGAGAPAIADRIARRLEGSPP